MLWLEFCLSWDPCSKPSATSGAREHPLESDLAWQNCVGMKTPEPALEWSAGIGGGFLSRYTYGRCLEAYRGIAVHMPGTSACHRGYKLFGETPGFPHARPLAPLPGAAQHCGSYRRSRRSRGGIRNQPRATAGFSAVPLADALCQLGIGSSAAPLEAVWDAAEPRLWLGAGDSPPLHSGTADGD